MGNQSNAKPAYESSIVAGQAPVNDPLETSKNRTLGEWLVGGPEKLRQRLERLGPTFIKIGQFLALRPDVIPQEYSDQLLHLLDDVPPFPWSQAQSIITEEIGDPAKIFRYINPRPAAAGSMAQVHLADLEDGTRVAVKVLRPGIEERVRVDLRRARALARLLQIAKVELIASPHEIVDELEQWLAQEQDLKNELQNMDRLYRLARNSPIEFMPQPYPDLSSKRVLTAEYVRGIPITELLRALDKGGEQEVKRRGWEIRLDDLAKNIVEATLTQIFRYQFFHADVHPGNLMVLSNDVIGYVDFGICGEIDENFRQEQVRYLSTVYAGDIQQMYRAALEVLNPGDNADVEGFRTDFMAVSSKWMGRVRAVEEETQNRRSPTAHWLIGVMRAARKNRFQVPPRLLAMYRTLLTAETIAHRLDPTIDLRSVGKSFFEALQIDDAIQKLRPEAMRTVVPTVLELMRNSPAQLNQVITDLADGRLTLQVQFNDDVRTRRAKDRRARLIASAIASVALALLISAPQLPSIGGVSIRLLLSVLLAILAVSSWIQWRRLK